MIARLLTGFRMLWLVKIFTSGPTTEFVKHLEIWKKYHKLIPNLQNQSKTMEAAKVRVFEGKRQMQRKNEHNPHDLKPDEYAVF